MKLLYLIMQPLVKRDFERYGIEFFLDKGHDITVLDLSEVIHPNTLNDRSKVVQDSRMALREIRNQKDLKAETKTFATCDLVFFLIYSFKISTSTYPALKIITKTGTPYLLRAPAYYPGATYQKTKKSLWATSRDIIIRFKNMDPINSILGRLPRQWLKISEADYIIYNGHASQKKLSLVGNKTIQIHAHSSDFDLYLSHAKTKMNPKNQAVFLDQFTPYHPGLIDLKSENKVNPDIYYRQLRNLFDRIENKFNLRVVICCHPRADYSRCNNIFGEREIYYGDTVGQVSKSCLVLAHLSTAISYPVLFKKPIMLLVTKELYEQHPSLKSVFEGFSEELGIQLSYYEKPEEVNLSDALNVNEALFDKYIHKYIKAQGSPSKPLWDIVHDVIVTEKFNHTQ